MKNLNFEEYLEETEPEVRPSKVKGFWDLLSTMKFAIWILILLGALSLVSMFAGELKSPQTAGVPPTTQIQSVGQAVWAVFQMDDPFRSWWYRLLLGLLCLSLFACILERTPIIFRLWTRKPPEDATWLQHAQHGIARRVKAPREEIEKRLHSGWSWRIKTDKLWIGEHGRVGMWGPLFTHIGMLLIGVGALVGTFAGLQMHSGGFGGESITNDDIPGLPYAVRIDSFRIQYYPLQAGQIVMVDGRWVGKLDRQQSDGSWLVREMGNNEEEDNSVTPVPADHITNHFNNDMDRGNIKKFSSWITVVENGKEVEKREIAVNSPLRRSGYRWYQSSYDPENPRFSAGYESATITLFDSAKGSSETLVLKQNVEQPVPGDTLVVSAGEMVPHFKLTKQGVTSESQEFVNPAVKLLFRGPKGYEKTLWVFLKFPPTESGPGKYTYRLASLKGEYAKTEIATIFEIRKTHGAWILWAGFIICSLGLCLCFYVTHRVVYVEWPEGGKGETRLTGISRKTLKLYALRIDRLLEGLEVESLRG